MSLKAKIEAVIYASEEPVTLAQLAGLLGQEAQAELDHLDSAQQTLALDPEAQSAEPETQPEPHAESESETQPEAEAVAQPEAEADSEAQPDAHSEAAEAEAEPSEESSAKSTDSGSDSDAKPFDAAPSEPEPMDPPPSQEPEPTEDSPLPEHPAPAAAPETKPESKQDEKAREKRLRDYFRSILDELIADYAADSNDRGLEIREVAGGFRLATKPQYHDAVRGFVKSLKPPLKLSLQALETLAVVAYKQPVTAPEVSEIRGVDSGGVLGSLMARKLITTAGRKQVIGRPILYKTTRDFLLRFGLKDINELPSIEEFEKMAGELADAFAEPVQEEIPMPEHAETESESESPAELQTESELAAELEPEADAVEPQADGDETPVDSPSEPSSESETHQDEAAAKAAAETEPEPEAPTEPAEAAAEPAKPELTEAIDQSHSSPLRADQDASSDSVADEVLTDGRISGLPPVYDDEVAIGTLEGIDSPAHDAELQSESESNNHSDEAAYTREEGR